ncbi:hypothetical protein ACEQ8H_007581 [Pleosporales sp. CAS-2024a]
MAPPRAQLPRQWLSWLAKLRSKVESEGLSMDSLPPHTSFILEDTIIRGHQALRFRLGRRAQDDGSCATTWAYMLQDGCMERWEGELTLPVLIRDELTARDGSTGTLLLVKRSATSLLRRAEKLLSPFCFLQFDLDHDAKKARHMLCALVLYYSLVAGRSETAMTWDQFETRFVQALDYIESNPAYLTRDGKKIDSEAHRHGSNPVYVTKQGVDVDMSTTAAAAKGTRLPDPAERGEADLYIQNNSPRAHSVLSISSSESVAVEEKDMQENKKASRAAAPSQRTGYRRNATPELIDLCGDEELEVMSSCTVEATPETKMTPQSEALAHADVDKGKMKRPFDTRKMNRSQFYTVVDINDDGTDDILEADGGAWKKASFRRSQRDK